MRRPDDIIKSMCKYLYQQHEMDAWVREYLDSLEEYERVPQIRWVDEGTKISPKGFTRLAGSKLEKF